MLLSRSTYDMPAQDHPDSYPPYRTATRERLESEQSFFHLLGISTDILGFDLCGNLQLSFAYDDDGSNT